MDLESLSLSLVLSVVSEHAVLCIAWVSLYLYNCVVHDGNMFIAQ